MALLLNRGVCVLYYAILTHFFKSCSEEFFNSYVRNFLSEMGPTYIKLGQWIATRPDIFPLGLCVSLEKLYDKATPHSWRYTNKVLKQSQVSNAVDETVLEQQNDSSVSWSGSVLGYITDIEKQPINCGSIAQIYKAKLKKDVDGLPAGTELALKVRHPGIVKIINADIKVIKIFIAILNFVVPDAYLFNLHIGIREFECLISSQLDLRIECDNLNQFRYNFRNFDGVIFPTPLPTLTSNELLVETFENGDPIGTINCNQQYDDIAELGCNMFMKMLFEDNFIHSDLHPGNILVRTNSFVSNCTVKCFHPDGKQVKHHELIILDTGLVTSLSPRDRENFISLFAAVACGEGELGANLMIERFPSIELHQSSNQPFATNVDTNQFREDMKEIFSLVSPAKSGFLLSEVKIGDILMKILTAVRKNNAPLDGNFATLVLTVVIGEGLGRKLTPNFNLFSESAPYLIRYLEGSELYFLSRKLSDTYGTQGLILQSSSVTSPSKLITFLQSAWTKALNRVTYYLCS